MHGRDGAFPRTMKTAALPLLLLPVLATAADYKRDIMPILKAECFKCHSEELGKEKGGFVFDNLTRFAKDIGAGRVIEPGNVEGSHFFETLINDVEEDSHMPPKKKLTDAQIAKFKEWIAEGATFDGTKGPVASAPAPAAAAPAPTMTATAPVMQNWTNTDGKTINAALIKVEGDTVVLRMSNGLDYNYPMTKLSPESQAQARSGVK